VQLWGLVGVQKETVLASQRSIVTVEEVVDELVPRPDAVVLPAWVIDAVCAVSDGAHPSFAIGYSTRDNGFYKEWDTIARDRDTFTEWIDRHVMVDA
jgi:glutaconate CoA-transferase subunit A